MMTEEPSSAPEPPAAATDEPEDDEQRREQEEAADNDVEENYATQRKRQNKITLSSEGNEKDLKKRTQYLEREIIFLKENKPLN